MQCSSTWKCVDKIHDTIIQYSRHTYFHIIHDFTSRCRLKGVFLSIEIFMKVISLLWYENHPSTEAHPHLQVKASTDTEWVWEPWPGRLLFFFANGWAKNGRFLFHFRKFTPEKGYFWNITFLLVSYVFRGYVKLRGCMNLQVFFSCGGFHQIFDQKLELSPAIKVFQGHNLLLLA